MLSPSDYLAWCERLQLLPETRTLISAIRSSPPARLVQSRAGNVSGRYPSRKMGTTIQFESHHVELWAIYMMEHESAVLEYFDQPGSILLRYPSRHQRPVTARHTPDFFVLSTDGGAWEEWKTEDRLHQLAITQPHRYQQEPDGRWRCPPGEAYAAPFGLTYRVRSSAECSSTTIDNLTFLASSYRKPLVVAAEVTQQIQHLVAEHPGITLQALHRAFPHTTIDTFYTLIAAGAIFVDITTTVLRLHEQVRCYTDQPTAAALHFVEISNGMPLLARPRPLLTPHTILNWDGQAWTLLNRGASHTTLLSEYGDHPVDMTNAIFDALLDTGRVSVVTARDPLPPSQDVRHLLASASPAAKAEANRRFAFVQAYLDRRSEDYAAIPERTLRDWHARYRQAQAQSGSGYVGLLPRTAARGNRLPRAEEQARTIFAAILQTRYTAVAQIPIPTLYQHYQEACTAQQVTPIHRRTFYRWLHASVDTTMETHRQGKRATYPRSSWYWDLATTTPSHGDRPFAIAHLDHTELDIELRSSLTGRLLGRPWATLLLDAYSRRVLAVYLSFDPPSYRSAMMALRICVRTYERLPEILVVDGGTDFASVYFETLLARFAITKKTRPGSQPRFGAVIERLFGTTNTQFLYTLRGNTQASKVSRELTPAVDPRAQAIWTLPALYDDLWHWATEIYDQTPHPAFGQSPRDAFVEGIARTGTRDQERIAYDDDFVIATCPTTRKGTAMIQAGHGFKLNYLYYWHPRFRDPSVTRTAVPVRYDPFDLSHAYAFVQGQWLTCQSQTVEGFQGRTEREVQLALEEVRQRQRATQTQQPVTAQLLASFLAAVGDHEQLLQQRLQEHDQQQVRDQIAVTPSATAPVALVRSVDLSRIPTYEEYRS